MIYLIDDDQHNFIHNRYNCEFIFEDNYVGKISYFKDERDFKVEFDQITENDVVCYHNSFPNDETHIIDKLAYKHEINPKFRLICFSNDSSFYTPIIREAYIQINKELFYKNLQSFVDTNCNVRKLIYGEMDMKNELDSLIAGIKEILYNFPDDEILDLTYLKPSALKRICEITELDYKSIFISIQEKSVVEFKKLLTALSQNI